MSSMINCSLLQILQVPEEMSSDSQQLMKAHALAQIKLVFKVLLNSLATDRQTWLPSMI